TNKLSTFKMVLICDTIVYFYELLYCFIWILKYLCDKFAAFRRKEIFEIILDYIDKRCNCHILYAKGWLWRWIDGRRKFTI
ncbi:MAG: hypothetical protein K5657_09985, partial [Desulfovibrio sp.]|nr:hypothetical protein [Desulfovibrio sp.]